MERTLYQGRDALVMAMALTPPREFQKLFRQKEVAKLAVSFFRRLFGKIMPARQRLGAADVGGVVLPDLGRLVVAADRAGRAPQDQRRACDLPAGCEIDLVHVEVDAV